MSRLIDESTGYKLQDLYTACTDIHIHPYNANIAQDDKRHEVRIEANVCTKGQYAKICISASNLALAINKLHYMVTGYRKLAEEMP